MNTDCSLTSLGSHFSAITREKHLVVPSLRAIALLMLLSSVASAQTGELLAKRGLIIKGTVEANLRLLSEGGLTIEETARIRGNAVLPEEKVPPSTPLLERGRVAKDVLVVNRGGDNALRGQTVGLPSFDLPPVSAPSKAKGTKSVVIDGSESPPADFSDVKDLSVRYTFSPVAMPPGKYGKLVVEGARLVLGTSGGRVPVRYSFQSLDIRDNGTIDLVGPVIITTAGVAGIDGALGRADLPGWLDLRVTAGAVEVSTRGSIYGTVLAPTSAVTLNGQAKMEGWLAADLVTVGQSSRFKASQPDWSENIHPARAAGFAQKAVLVQSQLADFSASQAEQFSTIASYSENDLPTLTLTELAQRKGEKAESEDQVAFFDACCVLLAFTNFDQGRVVIERAFSLRKKTNPLVIEMTKQDFIGHIWALDQREVTPRTIQEIREDAGLLERFMRRSVQVAAAKSAN